MADGAQVRGVTRTLNGDEITAPLPARLRGQIRVHPLAWSPESYALDSARRHRWWPVAPCSRIEVEVA